MNKTINATKPPKHPDLYNDLKAENARLQETLEFAKGAIMDAIYLEDGLDGAAGEAVLEMIDEALLEDIRKT